jgi:hypothetical protein
MRIPKSYNSPHQVGQQGSFRFFGRGSNGKFQLDVDALRTAFRQGPEVRKIIKDFRSERIAKITTNATPLKLSSGSKIVVHLAPLETFANDAPLDLRVIGTDASLLPSILEEGGRTSTNLDGYLGGHHNLRDTASGYVQLFRNACLEVVEHVEPWHVNGRNFLPGLHFDELIQNVVKGAPILAMLSLIGMEGRLMGTGQKWGYENRPSFNAPEILCPDFLIDDLTASPETIAFSFAKPAWNAAGYEQSVFYDRHGKWLQSK